MKKFTQVVDKKLSQPIMETLSIIAFKQPVTKQEIEEIRGVNTDKILRRLLERDLFKKLAVKRSSADLYYMVLLLHFYNVSA